MKKIISLNESDLKKIINKVIERIELYENIAGLESFAQKVIGGEYEDRFAGDGVGLTGNDSSSESGNNSSSASGNNSSNPDSEKEINRFLTKNNITSGTWKFINNEIIQLKFKVGNEDKHFNLKPKIKLSKKDGNWKFDGNKITYLT